MDLHGTELVERGTELAAGCSHRQGELCQVARRLRCPCAGAGDIAVECYVSGLRGKLQIDSAQYKARPYNLESLDACVNLARQDRLRRHGYSCHGRRQIGH